MNDKMKDKMRDKHDSRKNSTASVIIASLCICLYLGALVSAVIRIYVHIEDQRDTAANEFGYIANLAARTDGFMDQQFIETVQNALNASATLEGLIISVPNGGYPFEKYAGRAISMANNSPRFINRFDFSRQPLFMPLNIPMRNASIEARAAAVDYNLVTGILKQTLLLVCASLLLAFFTLLMQSLLEKSPVKAARSAPVYDTDPASGFYADKVDTAPVSRPRQREQRKPPEPKPPSRESKTRELPRGLYSPRGNIGWEEYTGTRLDSELLRCAANEQDVVYMVMEFKDLDVSDENFYLSFADDAVAFFTMRDLIFEKGERGIAVIVPNMELDAAIVKAGEFHDRCMEKYGRVFKSQTDLCVGLSSRAGRLIDAPRLMFEASEALEKALADPASHIIAFKSDPEKYRAYIASRNARSI